MDYRYVILGSDGQAASAEDWSCPSDGEAMERAVREIHPFGAELWRGQTRVGVLSGPMSGGRGPMAKG